MDVGERTGRQVRRQLPQVGDEKLYTRIIEREAWHEIVQGAAVGIDPFADGPRERLRGVAAAAPGRCRLGPRMRHGGRIGRALAKEILAVDRRNDDPPLLHSEAAAPVAVGAGRALTLDRLASVALTAQRLAVGQDAVAVEGCGRTELRLGERLHACIRAYDEEHPEEHGGGGPPQRRRSRSHGVGQPPAGKRLKGPSQRPQYHAAEALAAAAGAMLPHRSATVGEDCSSYWR